ncbi:MAG: hypothetical protein V4463_11340 [Pseudomonadota bacterium]
MKKIIPVVALFLFAMLLWNLFFGPGDMNVVFDGDEVDGPLGAVLAVFFAGGGLLLAAGVLVVVGAILALVFAGLGIMLVGGLGLGAIVLALAVSPLLLPALIPIGIIWMIVGRNRRNRMKAQPA